jgi:hypothetical protein
MILNILCDNKKKKNEGRNFYSFFIVLVSTIYLLNW